MRVVTVGTGGAGGWPEPGCRCASCHLQLVDGRTRGHSTIVVDNMMRLGVGDAAGTAGGDAAGTAGGDAAGYRVRRVADARDPGEPGGWDVTGPDGRRLLYAARPGAVPVPPEGTAAYDIALLDLLGEPTQLGLLRARGLITAGTLTAVAFADHRVPSEGELKRRCGFWGVALLRDGDAVTTVRSEERKLWPRVGGPWRVLVLGGARSGKSEQAELRLAGEPDVTYVATGPRGDAGSSVLAGSAVPTGDPEWAARVAAHRARRPHWWRTVETTDLAGVLREARGAVLIDGIGTWLAAVMDECGAWDGPAEAAGRPGAEAAGRPGAEAAGQPGAGQAGAGAAGLAERIAGLVGGWRQTGAHVVAVSDETGLGVVPETRAGRLFRDELGRLNRLLAAESEETELVVAGRILRL
jgi:adenosylcobinamide kinase / adenosylcobinamide-phosphate guanylyltransferase